METEEPTGLTPSQAARLIASIRPGKDFDPAVRRYLAVIWHRARVRERKVCPVCGAEFEGLVRAKYCGRRCARRKKAAAEGSGAGAEAG